MTSDVSPLDDLNPHRLHPPTKWLSEQTAYDTDAGVYYEPFVYDGRVGYRVASTDGMRQTYVYFNPSTGSDDGVPTVFIYQGEDNDPAIDEPDCHIVIDGVTGPCGHFDVRRPLPADNTYRCNDCGASLNQ
jgi:hypothetical protein